MNVSKSTVTKLLITGMPDLDPVHVFVDDMRASKGRITLTCFDDSWSYFWGSIGNKTITEFFCACDEDYLARKFKTGISSTIVDVDAIEKHAKAEICKRRRERDIEQGEARELFDEIYQTSFDDPYGEPGLMYRVYGDEWWHSLPHKPNPDYEYLCRIINVAKQVLSQEMVTA